MNSYKNTCTVYDSRFSCFSELTEEQVKFVERNKVIVKFKKGEIICKQGAFSSNIIYLREGLVKIYMEHSPRNLVLKISLDGTLIGLPSIYEGNNTFLYSAAAYVDSVVEMIDINVFKKLIRENAKFAYRVINVLNENTVQIYGRFFCLTNKQLHGRVADILLCLANRVFRSQEFYLPLNRAELAELANMSTESVIRVLKDFNEDGLIEVSGKSIKITNYEMLARISDLG